MDAPLTSNMCVTVIYRSELAFLAVDTLLAPTCFRSFSTATRCVPCFGCKGCLLFGVLRAQAASKSLEMSLFLLKKNELTSPTMYCTDFSGSVGRFRRGTRHLKRLKNTRTTQGNYLGGQTHAYVAACTPRRHVKSFTSQNVRLNRSADGEHSLTASLSDAHGEESPRVVSDTEEIDTDDGTGNITQSSPRNAKSGSITTGQADDMISPDRPPGACESTPPEHNGTPCAAGEHSPGTAPDHVGPKGVPAHDIPVRPGEEGNDGMARGPGAVGGGEDGATANENASIVVEGGVAVDEMAVGSCDGAGGGGGGEREGGNEPPTPGVVAPDAGDGSTRRTLSPEDALLELSRAGQKALDGDEDDDSEEVLEAGGGGAIGGTNLARSLFGDASIARAGGAHRVAGGGKEPVLGAEAGCHEVGVVFVALSREPIKVVKRTPIERALLACLPCLAYLCRVGVSTYPSRRRQCAAHYRPYALLPACQCPVRVSLVLHATIR